MKKMSQVILLNLLIIFIAMLIGCKTTSSIDKDKLITKALKYADQDNIIFATDLDKNNLAYDKFLVKLEESKRDELIKQVNVLKLATDKKVIEKETVKLNTLYTEIKNNTVQGSKPTEQVFISVSERAKPYVEFLNLAYKNNLIMLADKDKPLELKIVPKIGKEITSIFYNKITKILDSNTNKVELTKDKVNLAISPNDLYQIELEKEIEIDITIINNRDMYNLSFVNNANLDNLNIFELSNDNSETELDLKKPNKIMHNTTIKIKALNVPENKTALLYINNKRYDFDVKNELLYRVKENIKLDLKYVEIYKVSIKNNLDDINMTLSDNPEARFDQVNKEIITTPDSKIRLTFMIKEKYEIKDLVEQEIGDSNAGTYRKILVSDNILLKNLLTNLQINYLISEYEFVDLSNELPKDKQKYMRKYQLTFKVIANMDLNFNLSIIKFNLKLVPYTLNNNTSDIFANQDKYFTTSVASLNNIDALTLVKFTFKGVKDNQFRVLYVNNKSYNVGDTFELLVNDDLEIKYAIIDTYKVSIKKGQEDKFNFLVDDITKPIQEGTYVTFTIKGSNTDMSSKILVNGEANIVKYNPLTNEYSFKLSKDSQIEIIS